MPRVLLAPPGFMALPEGFEEISPEAALAGADVVAFDPRAGFAAHAVAYACQLRGALLLCIGDEGALPAELACDAFLPATAPQEAVARKLRELSRLRDLERASLELTALFDAPAVEAADQRYAEVHARLHAESEQLRRTRAYADELQRALSLEKRRYEQLMARAARAEGLSAVGRVAAGVVHEVNNPLGYATNALQVLRRRLEHGEDDGSPPNTELLAMALDGCARIRAALGDLRKLTRAQAEVRAVVDLRGPIDYALKVAAGDLRHRARLCRSGSAAPLVWGDEVRLGQVVINLLYNAIEAFPLRARALNEVHLRLTTTADGAAQLEVEDNGPGIPEEQLANVFDPFFTTKSEGTGLGLAICRDIVEAYGGCIGVASCPGRGTTVTVVLPAAEPARPQESLHPPPESSRAAQVSACEPVLIVDDEAHFRSSLAWVLGDVPTITVESISEARAVLERQAVSAILCDLLMPEGLGTDLLAWVRTNRPELASRFAVMTAGLVSGPALESIGGKRVPVLEKPFTRAELLRVLVRLGLPLV